jgi:CRP-like cAMP-binding protein
MSENTTQLTLKTILERITALDEKMERRFNAIEHQLEQMDVRLDEIASFAHQSRSEVLALRASFKTNRMEDRGVRSDATAGSIKRTRTKQRA